MRTQGVEGTRVGNETLTYLPASCRLKPMRDFIAVEPLDWKPSTIIDVVYTGKPLRGTVRAVGPGRYPIKYDGPKGKRTKSWDSQVFRPTEVRVGDVVELGGLEIRGYLFTTIRWGHREIVMCREQDVALIHG